MHEAQCIQNYLSAKDTLIHSVNGSKLTIINLLPETKGASIILLQVLEKLEI